MPRATRSSSKSPSVRHSKSATFWVGQVKAYRRGRVWYLQYHEHGARRRPRVGPDRDAARRLAGQTNAQLETGDVAVLSFEPASIPELRQRWLDHHEHVLRSSVQTVARYRAATRHLADFVVDVRPVRLASQFNARDAEGWVCLPDRYDDGGFSGGNLERPAMARLLPGVRYEPRRRASTAGRWRCM